MRLPPSYETDGARCHGALHAIVADILRADALVPIFSGHDAILSCLGQRSRNDAHLLGDAANATLAAKALMRAAGLKRA